MAKDYAKKVADSSKSAAASAESAIYWLERGDHAKAIERAREARRIEAVYGDAPVYRPFAEAVEAYVEEQGEALSSQNPSPVGNHNPTGASEIDRRVRPQGFSDVPDSGPTRSLFEALGKLCLPACDLKVFRTFVTT